MRTLTGLLLLALVAAGCPLPRCGEHRWVHVATYTHTSFVMVGKVMVPQFFTVPEHDEVQCVRWERP